MSKKKPTFDIAKLLKPLVVETEQLGRVSLTVRTSGFLAWLEAGLKADRWADPRRLVRDLVKEQAGSADGEEVPPPDEARIAALGEADLDDIAARILAASKRQFVPNRIVDAKTGKLRERTQDDPDPLPPLEGETESARLLRILTHYLGYYQAQAREMTERVRREFSSLDELTRRFDTIGSLSREFRRLGIGNIHDELASATRWHSELQGTIRGLVSNPFLEQQRRIAAQFEEITSPMRRLQEAMGTTFGRLPFAGTTNFDRLMENERSWASLVSRHYSLGFSARELTGLSATQTASRQASALFDAAWRRPGFQTAAMLGLSGILAQGAIADLLKHYDAMASPNAPAFGAVLAAAAAIDQDEESPEALMTAFDEAWTILRAVMASARDALRDPAVAAWLAIVIGLYAAVISTMQWADGRSSDLPERVTAATDELKAINEGLAADRGAREAQERLRYVHQVVNLRAEPAREGQLIRLVYPDQVLRLIDRRGDWAFVEIFDYPADAPARGWVHRRYLRRSSQ